MKRKVAIFLMALVPALAFSQGNESLLNEDKVWIMGYISPYQVGKVDYIESKLEGDTVIGNIT